MTFPEAVDQYQEYAYRLAFRLLCREEEARDAVQEAFIKIWKNWDQYDEKRRFSTWMYAIVTHVCLDYMRSAYYRKRVSMPEEESIRILSEEQEPGMNLSNEQLARLIRQISEELPEKQRIVFVLRDLQDLEMPEIAEITRMRADQIKANLCVARKTVREKLASIHGIKKEDYELR